MSEGSQVSKVTHKGRKRGAKAAKSKSLGISVCDHSLKSPLSQGLCDGRFVCKLLLDFAFKAAHVDGVG